MEIPTSPVLIIGTGAMASLFAARLAGSGISVKMLGTWLEGISALNQSGVRLSDENGKEQVYPVEATDDPQECAGSRFAIVLVKSYQTKRVAYQLLECLTRDGVVLTLQNGLNNQITLADVLGTQRVGLGVTTIGATLIEPGWVRIGGNGVINLGKHQHIQPFAALLKKAGFSVETVGNTDSFVWGKLTINAAINPLTALLQVPNGDLLTIPSARQLMSLVALETANVAEKKGIQLPFSDPVSAVESVALQTASNHSSMFKDVIRGTPTEVDAINGAVVKVGEAANVQVDVNRTLWLLIKAIVNKTETNNKKPSGG
jgi:2-dehydropantoate 2-reductase